MEMRPHHLYVKRLQTGNDSSRQVIGLVLTRSRQGHPSFADGRVTTAKVYSKVNEMALKVVSLSYGSMSTIVNDRINISKVFALDSSTFDTFPETSAGIVVQRI